MSKKAIIGITSNPPQRMSSHTAGWANKWCELTGAEALTDWSFQDLKEYDSVAIWNDINGEPGKLNLFGFKPDNEVGEKIQYRINEITEAIHDGVAVWQLDYHQTWHHSLTKRGLWTPPVFDDIPSIQQYKYGTEGIVIGDSHSISVAPTGWAVNRNDGQTLYGALKKGLSNFETGNLKPVIFKFGDIDLRHHIMRQDNHWASVYELVVEYHKQVNELPYEAYVVLAMPQVEDDRKIPKTGYYKGEPFYGDLQDRQTMTYRFNNLLRLHFGDKVLDPYSDLFNNDSNYLDQSKMEAGGSFHLAPHSYPTEYMTSFFEPDVYSYR